MNLSISIEFPKIAPPAAHFHRGSQVEATASRGAVAQARWNQGDEGRVSQDLPRYRPGHLRASHGEP